MLLAFVSAGVQSRAEVLEAETKPIAPAPDAAQRPDAQLAVQADTDAPANPVPSQKSLPANIKPSSAVSEVIRLAESGVTEPVLLAYVTNSVHTFNLGAEEIIYLNDIGVPGGVVTAMIQRDQELKAGYATATASVPDQMEPAPLAGESEPPPVDNSANYAVEAPLTPPDADYEEPFYDSLAPYGNWVDLAGYGRCWQPTVVVVNQGWQPYFDCGHWVYSDCGWYWLSDYSWGWAPFHYGNWFRHARLGWCWMPGHTWGPSWVSWRYNNGYCGWAPLPPGAHFVDGIGLSYADQHVGERDDLGLRPDHYRFVAWNHFNDRELRPSRVPHAEASRIYDSSTVATRISGYGDSVINNGLPVSRVAAATRQPIHTVTLRDATEPILAGGRAEHYDSGGQSLSVYRTRPPSSAGAFGPNGTVAGRNVPRNTVGIAGAPAWSAHNLSGTGTESHAAVIPGARQAQPLILRGPQSSATRESAPPNSLVVFGSGYNRQPSAALQPSAESARSAPSAASALSAPSSGNWGRSMARPEDRPTPGQSEAIAANSRGDWRGTVASSPEPSWFNRNNAPAPTAGVQRYETRPAFRGSSEPAPGSAAGFSRPASSYVPQRTYSAPVSETPSYSAPMRAPSFSQPSAPSSHPAPSAPSAPSSSSSSSSSSHSGSSNHGNR